MSDTLVVVNPAAGGRRAGRAWASLEPEAREIAEFRVAMPEGPGPTVAAVREAIAAGASRVVAVGGDGTVHLVAGALLAAGAGERVTLGVVPAGTGSDFARALAIPRSARASLRRALAAPPRAVDAARCDHEGGSFFFVNIASAGVSGMVDEMVNAVPDRGATAFLRATLAALRRYRCVPVRIRLDGTVWHEGPLLVLAVANGTTFGKGMRVAPRAEVADGLFDVVVAGELSGSQLATLLPRLYFGRHLGSRHVKSARATTVQVEPLAPMPVYDVDGEPYPPGPATFTVLPGALRVAWY